jgi:hypothetical protein
MEWGVKLFQLDCSIETIGHFSKTFDSESFSCEVYFHNVGLSRLQRVGLSRLQRQPYARHAGSEHISTVSDNYVQYNIGQQGILNFITFYAKNGTASFSNINFVPP